MSPILDVQNVSKTYGRGDSAVHAITEVSLSVQEGELVLLMGPSGSGKTTLLLMCGTLLKPDAGRILIYGLDVTGLKENNLPEMRLKKVGFVFQQFNLLSGFTAIENVELVANLCGIKGNKARELAGKVLVSVGLHGRLSHLPEDLSGGEKQRVAIARAILNNPRLIIADEPTGNLDSNTRLEIVRAIKGIVKEQRRAALIASHDTRIESFADKVLSLKDGRLPTIER